MDVPSPPSATRALPGEGITENSAAIKHVRGGRKRTSDPFRQLETSPGSLSDLQSSPASRSVDDEPPSSLLMDLVLTPLNLITLVLSLSLVDYRQRQWRLSQHGSQPDTLWHRVTHWSWLHPEPYQDNRDGTWKHNAATAVQSPSPNPTWSTQKKHRAMAKLALDDAFAIRGRVLFALLVWSTLSVVALVYVAKRVFGWSLQF